MLEAYLRELELLIIVERGDAGEAGRVRAAGDDVGRFDDRRRLGPDSGRSPVAQPAPATVPSSAVKIATSPLTFKPVSLLEYVSKSEKILKRTEKKRKKGLSEHPVI